MNKVNVRERERVREKEGKRKTRFLHSEEIVGVSCHDKLSKAMILMF